MENEQVGAVEAASPICPSPWNPAGATPTIGAENRVKRRLLPITSSAAPNSRSQ
jgi:hypothetical protein